ncbi:MAG: hypothetical protein SFV23_22410, partial [Planctomycetaceae bacterium]|nr:hypothetical protein [Planctomycetaceae bacterium]
MTSPSANPPPPGLPVPRTWGLLRLCLWRLRWPFVVVVLLHLALLGLIEWRHRQVQDLVADFKAKGYTVHLTSVIPVWVQPYLADWLVKRGERPCSIQRETDKRGRFASPELTCQDELRLMREPTMTSLLLTCADPDPQQLQNLA